MFTVTTDLDIYKQIMKSVAKLTTLSRHFQDSEEPWRGNQHPNWLTSNIDLFF